MYKANSRPVLRNCKTAKTRQATRKETTTGRKRGTKTQGYFYRAGRGWCASDKTPLTYEDGSKIKDSKAPARVLRAALQRHLAALCDERQRANNKALKQLDTTLGTICNEYLTHCEANDAKTTFEARAGYLFDLCTGLPRRFRENPGTKAEREEARIHEGLGNLPLRELIKHNIDKWLDAHTDWSKSGGRRSAIQTIKRALNYAVEAGLLPHNPIKGYPAGDPGTRKTYITPEQEAAMIEAANKPFGEAIYILIRTGARYGCEFATVTAAEVIDHGNRMEWVWPNGTKVKGKERRILITDKRVIEIVRRQIERHTEGPIFRNTVGKAWTKETLKSAFDRLRDGKRLATKGVSLKGISLYSTRHTYAKRTLAGYWTGEKTNIEILSKLMGNTLDVCWKHYAQWDSTRTDHFWQAA